MFIVKEPPSKPFPYAVDGELSLLLDDWFHRSIYEQVAGLDAKPFNWIGESQSFLIDGKGQVQLLPGARLPYSSSRRGCQDVQRDPTPSAPPSTSLSSQVSRALASFLCSAVFSLQSVLQLSVLN